MGLEFHVCTINKSAHMKKSLETYLMIFVCYFCYFKFNVFDKHREKYAKPNFVKFISFEINYFVGTICF